MAIQFAALLKILVDAEDVAVVAHLIRVPDKWHLKMSVARFVSAQIPKLGNILWEHDISKLPNIVAALSKSKLDTNKEFEDWSNEKCRDHYANDRDNGRNEILKGKFKERTQKASGRDWKTHS